MVSERRLMHTVLYKAAWARAPVAYEAVVVSIAFVLVCGGEVIIVLVAAVSRATETHESQ